MTCWKLMYVQLTWFIPVSSDESTNRMLLINAHCQNPLLVINIPVFLGPGDKVLISPGSGYKRQYVFSSVKDWNVKRKLPGKEDKMASYSAYWHMKGHSMLIRYTIGPCIFLIHYKSVLPLPDKEWYYLLILSDLKITTTTNPKEPYLGFDRVT